jgi:hypothetical protein
MNPSYQIRRISPIWRGILEKKAAFEADLSPKSEASVNWTITSSAVYVDDFN